MSSGWWITHHVYVIETESAQRLAFEARSRDDAEAVRRASWFVRALDGFCSRRIHAEAGKNPLARRHERGGRGVSGVGGRVRRPSG